MSASGKFEDQFYHAHEGSRAMGKLKNRTYLKKNEKKDSTKTKKNANVNGKDVEQFSDSDIIYSGYLVKQGSFWKTWRRRYFILRRDVPVLSYYDSAEELTKLGEIAVDGTTAVRPTPKEGFPFQFVVEHDGRKLTLVAEEGKPSTDAWISNIQLCIQRRAAEADSARQSVERKSMALRLSENSSMEEDLSSFRKSVGISQVPRDSPHGSQMKRHSTDSVVISAAMQESIAAREEEEKLRERQSRQSFQSRSTKTADELPPTWKAPTRRESMGVATRQPRRFRSFSAGSVLSTRSHDYEPMRPRDDLGFLSKGSRLSVDASSAYPFNEHPQTRAPCLSLPNFKRGPTLELAVSVGSKGIQEAVHMVVVLSTVSPGKVPHEISRTEMQGALTIRACGGDFYARDFNAALSVPLSAKDVLHFEIYSFKNPGTEVLASQMSLGFVRISPVDVMLSRDSTIVLECHRSSNTKQLHFLMLDRIIPSEPINLAHTYTYAKRHFIADIVPAEKKKSTTPDKLQSTSGVPSSLGQSYGEMVRGKFDSQDANHVFITEELSSSYCSISVALAFLKFTQTRNKQKIDEARSSMNEYVQKYGPVSSSPTHKSRVGSENDSYQEMESQLTRYTRLRDVYRTCEDYCSKLQTMLEDGKEPGVTGSLKRSTQKKDLYTEFMPTNLNCHLTRAKRVVLSNSSQSGNGTNSTDMNSSSGSGSEPVLDELVHTVITHGCTAAHVLGFKEGGLRKMLQTYDQSPRDNERLLEKIEQRQDVVRSQVLSVASAAFLTVVGLAASNKSPIHMDHLKLICSTGFLISIESLLSTLRSEKGMIEDMVEGVKWLNSSVSLQVTEAVVGRPSLKKRSSLKYAKCIDVSSMQLGSQIVATFALPSEVFAALPDILKKGDPVKIHAVMFTQGINEMQSVANTVMDTSLQDEINYESVQALERYFHVYQAFVKYNARHNAGSVFNDARLAQLPDLATQIGILVVKLNVSIKAHVQKKNVNILLETSEICRRLGAGRTTCCKSGKDRTSMSVTLESSQILVDTFHVKQGVHLCTAMRERGVRRVNVLANTGKDKYAFNSFQLKYIPECYKPPTASADSHVAS